MRVLLQSVVESFLGGEADPAEASVEARFFILRTRRDVTDVQAHARTHIHAHTQIHTHSLPPPAAHIVISGSADTLKTCRAELRHVCGCEATGDHFLSGHVTV